MFTLVLVVKNIYCNWILHSELKLIIVVQTSAYMNISSKLFLKSVQIFLFIFILFISVCYRMF